MVVCLGNDALSGPLPELGLGSPELFAIAANHQGGAFPLFSLLFFWAHLFTFSTGLLTHFRHRMYHTSTSARLVTPLPRRETSMRGGIVILN
jgi:hypothetical protein